MLVFIDTTRGTAFSIVLNPYDRVFDIKKQIENSLGIAVSTQQLYYKGEALLVDDLDLKTCNIVNSSRLFLVLPDENNYQVLPQTEQAPAPSNYITSIEDSLGKNQGWPQMHYQTEDSQVAPSNTREAFDNQGRPAMAWSNDDQMLHQTKQSLVPSEAFFNKDWPPMARSNDGQPDKSLISSCSIEELLNIVPETPLTDQDMRKMQGFWPASTTEGNVNFQESPGRNDNNQDFLQRESSNTFVDFSFGEDRTLSTERFPNTQCHWPAGTTEEIINKNQVFQTEQSTLPSNTYGDFSFGEDRRLSTEHFTNSQSYLPTSTSGDIFINKDQVFQTKQSTVPSNSFGGFSFEYPLSTEGFTDATYFPTIPTGDIISENQALQTGQTPVPSNSTDQRINTQDFPMRVGSINELVQREKSPRIREVINTQNLPVRVGSSNEVVQREKSPPIREVINIQDFPMRVGSINELVQREKSPPIREVINTENFPMRVGSINELVQREKSPPIREVINTQNFPMRVGSINELVQREKSPPIREVINTQNFPVRVGRSNEMVQREKSPPIREVINIPDSPVKVSSFKPPLPKLRVMMLPYSRENKPVSKFPVNVNASENVEELRKELDKIQQRTQLNLPQDGYFFIHKQRVLDDDQSFEWNGVAHGDTIEIFPGHVTKDDSRTEKRYRTFGI